MIDAADRDAALAIINVWNDPDLWAANLWADRSESRAGYSTRPLRDH